MGALLGLLRLAGARSISGGGHDSGCGGDLLAFVVTQSSHMAAMGMGLGPLPGFLGFWVVMMASDDAAVVGSVRQGPCPCRSGKAMAGVSCEPSWTAVSGNWDMRSVSRWRPSCDRLSARL